MDIQPPYLFLDDAPERELLIERIREVRQAVVKLTHEIPPEEHYAPRYHGWSLAAMLAHLNTVDTLSMWLIQAALLGVRPSMSVQMLNRTNDLMARLFRRRLVTASLKSAAHNERRIARFIRHLPVGKFSSSVFHPNKQQYITVERALQDLLLHHWHEHLATMRQVEAARSRANSES